MTLASSVMLVIAIGLICVYGNTTGWVRYTSILMACALIGINWR